MDQQSLNTLMIALNDKLSSSDLMYVLDKAKSLPNDAMMPLLSTELKSPTTSLIISFLGGSIGIDRFYVGDTGLGILKLITCGLGGIWSLVDLFLISGRTREVNSQKVLMLLNTLQASNVRFEANNVTTQSYIAPPAEDPLAPPTAQEFSEISKSRLE